MSQVSELLRTTLERLNWTQKRLADESGLTPKHVNAISQSKAGMTGRTAVILERATAVPASEWLLADATDREEAARAQLPTRLEEIQWYIRQRFNDLGYSPEEVQLTPRDREVVKAVLKFLSVDDDR